MDSAELQLWLEIFGSEYEDIHWLVSIFPSDCFVILMKTVSLNEPVPDTVVRVERYSPDGNTYAVAEIPGREQSSRHRTKHMVIFLRLFMVSSFSAGNDVVR